MDYEEMMLQISDVMRHANRLRPTLTHEEAVKAIRSIVAQNSEWIPIKTRLLTNEERVEFAEYYGVEYCDTVSEVMFDCPMPEDGQEILITTKYGVETDICCIEDCVGTMNVNSLEDRGDWEGVIAWMPMPEPYRGDA